MKAEIAQVHLQLAVKCIAPRENLPLKRLIDPNLRILAGTVMVRNFIAKTVIKGVGEHLFQFFT